MVVAGRRAGRAGGPGGRAPAGGRGFLPLAWLWRAGEQDVLADPADVHLLAAALAPGVVVVAHEEPGYEHFDFTWGEDAHVRIYPVILDLLRLHV